MGGWGYECHQGSVETSNDRHVPQHCTGHILSPAITSETFSVPIAALSILAKIY